MPRPDYARDAEENKEFDRTLDPEGNFPKGVYKRPSLEQLQEGVEKKKFGESLWNTIDQGAVGTVQWLQQQAAENPDTWTDDALRIMGGGLRNTAWAISKIPGLSQLAQAEDFLADRAENINERLTPWLDPRFARRGTYVLTGLLADKGIRKATRFGRQIINTIDNVPQLAVGLGGTGGAKAAAYIPRDNSSIIRGLSKNFAGPNKLDELNAYINAAEDYRINRLNQAVPKRDLMKGFSWDNDIRGAIFDDENIPWILVRQKRKSVWKGAEAPFADRTNYKLRKLEDVEYDILTRAKSTYSQAGKDLIRLKKELNRLKTNHPDTYYHRLMEYGGEAYIEHKVAKGQRWFWRKKAKDPDFASWSAASRNADENIRLFFNPRFKLLKDNIEKYLEKANPRLWKNDVSNRLVIDVEDPLGIMSGKAIPLAKRSHPGWITIKRARSGEIVGKIGDYLQDLYHPAFKGMFEEMQSSGGFRKIKDLQGNPLVKPGETFVSFRKRFLSQRVKFILDELDRLNKIPSKVDRLKFIDDAIKDDTIRFYNQFPEWTPPSILKEFLELTPGEQIHFPLY